MNQFTPRCIFAALVLTLAAPASAAESLSLLLQKAIYAEETEGNLEAAITIYEQIAAEAAANRALAAQAQYRLAVCYQKQGKKEQAVKVLNDLAQFPIDPNVSKKARQMLVELGQPAMEGVSIRRVPLPSDAHWAWSVSTDGQYISYSSTRDGDMIVIYDTLAGTSRQLDKAATKQEGTFFSVLFSPDGRSVAYSRNGHAIVTSKIDGSQKRTIYKSPNKEWIEPLQWSADATQVIVGEWVNDRPETPLFAINTTTETKVTLARLNNPAGTCPTSDWRYVAYRTRTSPGALRVANLQDGSESTIVESGVTRIAGWALGGSRIIYSKERASTRDLWTIDMKDGKAVGEPELVLSNVGEVYNVGITRDGSIYYQTRSSSSQPSSLWVMEGFLTRKVPPVTPRSSALPLAEIVGSDNAILDRKFGLSARLPDGWTIKSAVRHTNGTHSLHFAAPDAPNAIIRLNYAVTSPLLPMWEPIGPLPNDRAGIDAWLRRHMQFLVEQRLKLHSDYKIQPASVTSRMLGRHPALTRSAEYTTGDEKWVEHLTSSCGEKVIAQFQLQAPAAQSQATRPAFDAMIETLRLP